MNNNSRNLFIWLMISVLLFALFQMFPGNSSRKQVPEVAYSEFYQNVNNDQVAEVLIKGKKISGHLKDGRKFQTYAVDDTTLFPKLEAKGIKVIAGPPEEEMPSLFNILLGWFPILLLVGLSIFSLRQIQSGGNKALGFGKSRARMSGESDIKVTFDDVAGVDEAKAELEEVVEFLKDPQKFQRLGGKIPRGVLLVGPPGTGKTLLAKAIAGEASVPFFTISGSDFVEMFVGVGASRVRDMFDQAKKNAPCIIFIDEIDAVGRHRGAGMGGGNDEREQTLNQLLVEMDGFEGNQGVILIAATNRPDVLDPALLRPGRFDRQVVVPNPDVKGREHILLVHMRRVPLAPNVDPKVLARGTPGFSGADLANLVNEAALMAARKNKLSVSMADFELAKDKVMMGAERRSLAMSEEEKKLTAFHEGGHAIVAHYTPDSDPIHKATIIPRGRALGMVMRLPEGDRISMSRARLLADLKVAMGGRIAEELIFGHDRVTTGASSDIKMATDIARRMVTEWGLSSERLGFQSYQDPQQEVFIGHWNPQQKPMSNETARAIDEEIRKILDTSYDETEKLLKDKIDDLRLVASALIEYETLTGDEIAELLRERKLPQKVMFTEEEIKTRSSVPETTTDEDEEPSQKKQTAKSPKVKNQTKDPSPNPVSSLNEKEAPHEPKS